MSWTDDNEETELVEALRWGDVVVDPKTGEILSAAYSASAWDLDRLIEAHLESAQQEKQWKARRVIFGALLRRKLEAGSMRKYTSEGLGTASLLPGTRRTADPRKLEEVAEAYGLDPWDRIEILECSRELSVTDLDEAVKRRPELAEPVSQLISSTARPFVRVTPALKEAAPEVVRVKAERDL